MTHPGILTTIGLAALALAACGTSAPEPPPPCPTALVLGGAERTASYSPGAERGPDALRHLARINNLASGCRFGPGGVEVDLAFNLIAERGPAFSGDAVDLSYFVATIGPAQEILSKQLFRSEIPFAVNETLAGVNEQLTLRLPAATSEQASAYAVYLGFQLDEAELQERMRPLLR